MLHCAFSVLNHSNRCDRPTQCLGNLKNLEFQAVLHFKPLNNIFRSKQQVDFFDFERIFKSVFHFKEVQCFRKLIVAWALQKILLYTWSEFRGHAENHMKT
jgi:hypothetical protein